MRSSQWNPEGLWSAGLDEQAHRNEIDIRDTMLEAGCGKGSDRRDSRHDPIDVRPRAEAHPDSQANQRVAQDTERERREKSMTLSHLPCSRRPTNGAVAERVLRRVQHEPAVAIAPTKLPIKKTPVEHQRTRLTFPLAQAMTMRLLPVKSSAPAMITMRRPTENTIPMISRQYQRAGPAPRNGRGEDRAERHERAGEHLSTRTVSGW